MIELFLMDIKGAGILVINEDGEVLVLHRKPFVPEGRKWGLPGGKIEEGQEPFDAAKHKALHEVGLKFESDRLDFLGKFEFSAEGNDVVYSVWMARYLDTDGGIKLNKEGHSEFKWQKPEILLKKNDLMVGMYPILKKFLEYKKRNPVRIYL